MDTEVYKKYIGKYVILVGHVSGTMCGNLAFYDDRTRHAILENSRIIWSWTDRFTVNELAVQGLDEGKLSICSPETIMTDVVLILPTFSIAEKKLKKIKAHKP